MASDFINELKWRGLLQDVVPGTEELLKKEKVSGYIGFDPTSDSLHIGSLSQIFTLMRFQIAGHTPIALMGGATGMVGDPSGKSAERNLLDEVTLSHNMEGIKKQLDKFLDFGAGAILINNLEWMKAYTFIDFIRDIGKHLTVNYMMAKDSVKSRLESGMSFTEFSYQLIQAYDYFVLHQHHNCKLQMGGSDQWGNMTSGVELIRRKSGSESFALTTTLIRKSDGTKFGKTESGNIWLDRNKTSPYKFYQFWINVSDEDARNLIKYFTFHSEIETGEMIAGHDRDPSLRLLQKTLAKELTTLVHSEADYKQAVETSALLFSGGMNELGRLDESTFLDLFDGVPSFQIKRNEIEQGTGVLEFLAEKTTVFPSKSEARKMIQGGGVSINREKVQSHDLVINSTHLINNRYILVQKGKKNYFLCHVNSNGS